MANRIKGITGEIGGDATRLQVKGAPQEQKYLEVAAIF